MITLTDPKLVNIVLGGVATIPYDTLVLDQIRHITTGTKAITAVVRIRASSDPTMQEIIGSLNLDLGKALVTMEVQQLAFYRQKTLTAPQITVVTSLITDDQDALESGLITLALVDGTQSTGSLI